MAVIHTAYATIKMSGPKGVIVLKSDQRDALACENATLTHIGRFDGKEAQELAAKEAKTHGGSTPIKTSAPKPSTGGILWPLEKKNTFMGSTSNQHTADEPTDDKKKGVADKEVVVYPDDTDKKLCLSMELEAK
jgi:hypothetical protein